MGRVLSGIPEHELRSGQLLAHSVERFVDDRRVVDLLEPTGAEHDRAGAELEALFQSRSLLARRRTEHPQVGTPVDEHRSERARPEGAHAFQQILRIGHGDRRSPERKPCRECLRSGRVVEVRPPGGGDERARGGEHGEPGEGEPMRMDDVGAELAEQTAQLEGRGTASSWTGTPSAGSGSQAGRPRPSRRPRRRGRAPASPVRDRRDVASCTDRDRADASVSPQETRVTAVGVRASLIGLGCPQSTDARVSRRSTVDCCSPRGAKRCCGSSERPSETDAFFTGR